MIAAIGRLLSFLGLAWVAGFVWFIATLPEPLAPSVRTDGIVVLTGGSGRVARGLALIEAGAGKRLLISGVDPRVRPAELAAELRRPLTLFQCCVDLGKQAIDTRSNGDEVARWTRQHRYRSIRLVTSDYHMRRAELEIGRSLGPGVAIVADPVTIAFGPMLAAREWTKYAARRGQLLINRS